MEHERKMTENGSRLASENKIKLLWRPTQQALETSWTARGWSCRAKLITVHCVHFQKIKFTLCTANFLSK